MNPMNPLKFVLNFFTKKKELSFPSDFAIINFSKTGLQGGRTDTRNKKIFRHFINRFGNREIKTYWYSEERANALTQIYNIPIIDMTEKEVKFPVFSRISLGEVRFTKDG